jgi:hypothetical protein
MALGNVRFPRYHLASHPAAVAQFPHSVAEGEKKIGLPRGRASRWRWRLGVGASVHGNV